MKKQILQADVIFQFSKKGKNNAIKVKMCSLLKSSA